MTAIGICSGKGSPGATFVAVNLANALGRRERGVVLIDLDLSGGDVTAYLGLDPRKGLHLLSKMNRPRPSTDQIRDEIQNVHGFGAIGGLSKAESPDVMEPMAVAASARRLSDVALIDVGRVPGSSEPALDAVDRILVVVRPDVVSVLGAERCLAALGDRANSTELVITAHRRRKLGDLAEIGAALARPIAAVIPWVPGAARRALDTQKPIASGPAARAFGRLASTIEVVPASSASSQEPEKVMASA